MRPPVSYWTLQATRRPQELISSRPHYPQSPRRVSYGFFELFFRAIDNALLAQQEDNRLAVTPSTPFLNDIGQVQDDLLILKNHGVKMIRLRHTPLVVPGTSTPATTPIPWAAQRPFLRLALAMAALPRLKLQMSLSQNEPSSSACPSNSPSSSIVQVRMQHPPHEPDTPHRKSPLQSPPTFSLPVKISRIVFMSENVATTQSISTNRKCATTIRPCNFSPQRCMGTSSTN